MRQTIYFEENDIFGLELKSIQDVLNARSLGLHILPEGGEEYLDRRFDDDNESLRDATTDELIEDAQAAFKAVGKIYGIFDTPLEYRFVPAKATTLQTDFRVGQKVYLLVDNNVTKTAIKQMWLTTEDKNNLRCSDYIANAICNEFYERCQTIHANPSTRKYVCDKIDSVRAQNESFVCVEYEGRDRLVKLSEVFATKEELAKHLLEE